MERLPAAGSQYETPRPEKSENIEKARKKDRTAKAEKATKPDKKPKAEKERKVDKPKKQRLSRTERKEAAAAATLQSVDRQLVGHHGAPPIQRPLTDPRRLNVTTTVPRPPSMAEWSKSFQTPAAWTQPIATTYVQKRAMLATMKGAKSEPNDAAPQQGTPSRQGGAAGAQGPINPFAPRFGVVRTSEPALPPPVMQSSPISGDLARPRFSAGYNYSPPASMKPQYPTISPSKDTAWTPATVSATTLNPYFRKYAKPPEDEDKAVPYWQRRLDNPTASQQIRMIAQNWIVARKLEPAEPASSDQEMPDEMEQLKMDPPMAAAPTTIWLPKLPSLPPPGEAATESDAEPAEAAEQPDLVDLTTFQARPESTEAPSRPAADYAFTEQSYSSVERWTSLEGFDSRAEPVQRPPDASTTDDDIDWESMVRKPKLSRRKRRRAARGEWEPPAAERDFRDEEPVSRPREGFREPEADLGDQPELRSRRRSRVRASDFEEAIPRDYDRRERDYVERTSMVGGREPEPELSEAAHRPSERDYQPAVEQAEPQPRRRGRRTRDDRAPEVARRQLEDFDAPVRRSEQHRADQRMTEAEPLHEPGRRYAERSRPVHQTQVTEVEQYEARHGEVELRTSPRAPRHDEPPRHPRPARPRVKAAQSATLVEDGLAYVLVDDEGRAVLK
jgi:hypothetical protein